MEKSKTTLLTLPKALLTFPLFCLIFITNGDKFLCTYSKIGMLDCCFCVVSCHCFSNKNIMYLLKKPSLPFIMQAFQQDHYEAHEVDFGILNMVVNQ